MTIGDYAIRNPDSINNFYIEKKNYIKFLHKIDIQYDKISDGLFIYKKKCNQDTGFRVYPFLIFL